MKSSRRRPAYQARNLSGIGALTAILLACVGGGGRGEEARPVPDGMLDLSAASVVIPPGLTGPERKAVAMLVEEVGRRTQCRWKVSEGWQAGPSTAVAVGPASALDAFGGPWARELAADGGPAGPEGYRIRTRKEDRAVFVVGNDARGVLFGVGRLLRELRMGRGRVLLPGTFRVSTSPRVAVRGHQLGYRPKTNSYDGWDLAQWERYIRDLAVFGTNAVELIPPRSDDDADSPHFPAPPMDMMVGMSKLLDDYGLDVWIWYPAMDKDYADPKTVEFALAEWGAVFEKLPRIDAVFVPGGDPGHTRPRDLVALLEKQSGVLRRHHPEARIWVSPQGFDKAWLDEFFGLLASQPDWLGGLVFGPQVRVSLPELRAAVPSRYPIRGYPDITHSLDCQYPVPDWDLAFALTEGREPINPRPLGMATIFRTYLDDSIGFLTYSEGCNDDVNKIVWSDLGWDPTADVVETLRQYGRYFIGDRYSEDFAGGLLALEGNWRGPLLTNTSVEQTLARFRDMEARATPQDLANWRFQQALYRAYYDAHLRDRLIHETALEASARGELRRARELGSSAAIDRAMAILDRAATDRVSADRRARVHELAEALFQSIRMQLSVGRYKAIAVRRGANLDAIDAPLNDRPWLDRQFAEVRALGEEADRLRAIEAILGRTDPGPGGFYDDLGDPALQPHLVRGPGFPDDPAFLRSTFTGTTRQPGWPLAWCRYAQSLHDTPLTMRYHDLDPRARYRVRVTYSGDSPRTTIRLVAEGAEVHPLIEKPSPVRPIEFEIPPGATADGQLTLTWTQEPGRGGSGRGCQVAEVWLLRRDGDEAAPGDR